MTFAADGFDVSGLGQGAFDWSAVAGCTTRRVGGARIAHGAYSAPTRPTSRDEWDPATNPLVVYPGFIDSHAAASRDGMIATGVARLIWYVVVTPLESAMVQAQRVVQWVGSNVLPSGQCIAIDVESNPWKSDEVAGPDLVEELRGILATVYGEDRIGAYGSRGVLDGLRPVAWRWLASYTTDARDAAVERSACVVQWTSQFRCDGWPGNLDCNEVVDQGALDRACGISEVVVGAPVGSFDVVEAKPGGGVRVSGWMYDPDTPEASILAHVYVDGALLGTTPADRERTDVNTTLGIVGNHGFDATFDVPRATIKVDVYGIDSGGDPNLNALIGEKSVVLDLTPVAGPPTDPPVTTVPPPVDPPPVDPQPPTQPVDEGWVRTIARDEISKAHLTPGG